MTNTPAPQISACIGGWPTFTGNCPLLEQFTHGGESYVTCGGHKYAVRRPGYIGTETCNFRDIFMSDETQRELCKWRQLVKTPEYQKQERKREQKLDRCLARIDRSYRIWKVGLELKILGYKAIGVLPWRWRP